MRAIAACFFSAAFLLGSSEAGKASFLDPEYIETFGVKLWQNHKQDYNREYPGAGTEGSEDWDRFLNFKAVLKHCYNLNERNPTATFGFNTFTDYYPEEFLRVMAGTEYPAATPSEETAWETKVDKKKKSPETSDWTRKDAVTHVKHQSNCTAGAVFAFVAAAEAGAVRDGLPLRPLSEQWVLSCSGLKTDDIDPCSGMGKNRPNLEAVAKAVLAAGGGMPSEADVFYTSNDGKVPSCSKTPVEPAVKVTEVVQLPEDDKLLRRWLDQNGPFAAEVDAVDWQTYQDGIVDECEEGEGESVRGPGHAVLVTGYGTEGGRNYWMTKNSWGFAWGEHGYMRLRRGRGCLRSPLAVYTAKPQEAGRTMLISPVDAATAESMTSSVKEFATSKGLQPDVLAAGIEHRKIIKILTIKGIPEAHAEGLMEALQKSHGKAGEKTRSVEWDGIATIQKDEL